MMDASNLVDNGTNNVVEFGESNALDLIRITLKGDNNLIRIGADVRFIARRRPGANQIRIKGNNSSVTIGDHCSVNVMITIESSGAFVDIGRNTTTFFTIIRVAEGGGVSIGEDCMFSHDVQIMESDSHPIYDMDTGRRLNEAGNVTIGDHVWIGSRATILPGVSIGAGAVVGTGAVVTRDVPENSLAVGAPARIVRQGIRWERQFATGLSGRAEATIDLS